MQNTITAETMIYLFGSFRTSHPNLTELWITYLGLKKRHWRTDIANQALFVLNSFEQGNPDLNKNTIVSLLLYYQVMI